MKKKIIIGSDHAGFELKNQLLSYLSGWGWDYEDKGCFSPQSVDYPDFAHVVAADVANQKADIGVLVCASGQGVCITANHHAGIRAALCWSVEVAQLARAHNDANILCLPARFVSVENGVEIMQTFLNTYFEGGRHTARVAKIEGLR